MERDILETIDALFRHRLQATEIDPDAPIVDYGLDSVRSVELIVEMESLFDVQISDEAAADMRTLRDVAAKVSSLLSARAGTGRSG